MSGGGLSARKGAGLVGSIYDAALDAQLWPGVLNRIGDAVGGPQVVFGFYDPASGIVSMHAPRNDRTSCAALTSGRRLFGRAVHWKNYRPGEVFTGADASRGTRLPARLYNEVWQPGGFSAPIPGNNLFADSAASGHIASHGS